MALTVTVPRGTSSSLKYAIIKVVWDASYLTGGEVLDLGPNGANLRMTEIFGCTRISATLDDGNRLGQYVRDGDATGATGAPATGTIQMYQTGAAVNGVFIQTPSAESAAAMDGEFWFVLGR